MTVTTCSNVRGIPVTVVGARLGVAALVAAVGIACALIVDPDENLLTGHWVSVPGGTQPWTLDLQLVQSDDGSIEGAGLFTLNAEARAVTVAGTLDHPVLSVELRQDTLVLTGSATITRRDALTLYIFYPSVGGVELPLRRQQGP